MSSEMIWFVGLVITHFAFYYIGKNDAGDPPLSEKACIELEKYEIDKFYEHERWKMERGIKHDDENDG